MEEMFSVGYLSVPEERSIDIIEGNFVVLYILKILQTYSTQ